jgi:hypothetical protein
MLYSRELLLRTISSVSVVEVMGSFPFFVMTNKSTQVIQKSVRFELNYESYKQNCKSKDNTMT